MYKENLREKRELEDLKKEVRATAKTVSVQSEKIKSVDNIKQNVEVMQQSFETMQQDVEIALQEVETMQQDVEVLKEKIETIGDGGAEIPDNLAEVALTGNYHDLQGRPDEYFEMGNSFKTKFTQVFGVEQAATTTPEYWFICALDSVIEGTFSITYKPSRRILDISEKAQFMFNGEIFEEREVTTINVAVITQTYTFKIRPKKPINNFSFNFTKTGTWTPHLVLGTVNIDITYGKNIFFLNRPYNWSATVYKDKYLIFRDGFPAAHFFEKNKNDFDFTVGENGIMPGIGHSIVLCYSPEYDRYTKKMRFLDFERIYCVGYNNHGHYPKASAFTTNLTQLMMSLEKVSAYSVTYFRNTLVDEFGPGVAVVLGEDRRLAFWENGQFIKHEDFTLNGIPVQKNIWADNNAVMRQDMDNVIVVDYKGSVGTKLNGECIYFPAIHSEYVVPLGFGRRVNSFLQDDGSINVYLGRQNHVVRKVLVKNSETERYEIDKNQELRINGFEEVVETLDGYFIGLSDDEPELVPWEEVL